MDLVPFPAVMLVVAVFGLLVGSFLNVVIWRVPRGESVVSPPSACPACGHPVRRRDNVPVLSWLLLRGRCRDCDAPISARYPLVEAGTAVVFLLVLLRFGVEWSLPAYLYLAAIGVALTLIDLDVKRLPDAIVLDAYVVLAALLALASFNPGDQSDWGALVRATVGGAALWLFYRLLRIVKPQAMGWGDIKLAGVLGAGMAWVGWGSLVIGAFAAFLIGGVFSIGLILAGRARLSSQIPFGPWMILGAAVGIAAGEGLWSSYLGMMGLSQIHSP